MKAVITGANGQLGRDLVMQLKAEGHEGIGLDRQELDTTDLEQSLVTIKRLKPDVVIHSAAYTAVDLAEAEQDKAYRVNATGTRNVAVAAESVGAKCCYISTDYVLTGYLPFPTMSLVRQRRFLVPRRGLSIRYWTIWRFEQTALKI